ncbi:MULTISPECIES: hypothetical protein [Yersinia]|jgi:hypothetical protein|uniref:hypothetical protein n=1 Tax=Yersinia TaxID=629 RepID=UPI0009B71538|nr:MULTISPECIES: hypothetical protein [Yersinia]ARB82718.1 hypothetical protein A6J67_00450 [Yersinia sp. FDAARGOS_228]AVL36451.1 hypothetical protein CEQ36_13130 [Yersinia intermedia]
MDKAWDGNFRDIPADHFDKMKSTARHLAEITKKTTDGKIKDKDIFIRIGMSGTGVRPNYQVELPDGLVITINGINHESFGVEEFDRHWVSKPYSIEQLNNMRISGGTLEAEPV